MRDEPTQIMYGGVQTIVANATGEDVASYLKAGTALLFQGTGLGLSTEVYEIRSLPSAQGLAVGASVTLTPTAYNASGVALSSQPTFTFSSENTAAATVNTPSGATVNVAASSTANLKTNILIGVSGYTYQLRVPIVTMLAINNNKTNRTVGPVWVAVAADRLFTAGGYGATNAEGWDAALESAYTLGILKTDETDARMSPPNAIALRYPPGFVGGSGTVNMVPPRWDGAGLVKRFYCKLDIKLSRHFKSHNSQQKIFYLIVNGMEPEGIVLEFDTPEPDRYSVAGRYFGLVGVSWWLNGNSIFTQSNPGGGGLIARGIWHKIECEVYAGTVGVANGSVKTWIDDALVFSHTAFGFVRVENYAITAVTATNPVTLTTGTHGYRSTKALIDISGNAALNGRWTATVINTTQVTIPFNNTGSAAAAGGTIQRVPGFEHTKWANIFGGNINAVVDENQDTLYDHIELDGEAA